MKCKLLNTYKLKKHFKKGLTPLLCALTVFNICGISVNATSYSAWLNFSEPYVSDNQGYFSIMDEKGYVYTYIWTFGNYNYPHEIPPGGNDITDYYPDTNRLRLLVYESQNGFTLEYTSSTYAEFTLYQHSSWTNEFKVYMTDTINWSNENVWQTFGVSWGDTKIIACDFKGKYDNINLRDIRYNTLDVNFNNEVNLTPILTELEMIRKMFQASDSGNTSTSNVSDSAITSVEGKENSLIGNNVSTNDLNVSINPNAASVVWGLIDDLTTSNAKVFGMFISILTIAVIGLILNR